MTEAQRAHWRCLEALRDHVRTVEARPTPDPDAYDGKPGWRAKGATQLLRQKILYLKKCGKSRCEIARELNVSKVTVWRHITGRR